MLLIPSFVVFALHASALTSGIPLRPGLHIRTLPTEDNAGLGWNRLSHLRVSSTCTPDPQCLWPAHSGSSLFRLFRGRRSIARIGPELMYPSLSIAGWNIGVDNQQHAPSSNRLPLGLSGAILNNMPLEFAYAVRRGPGGISNRIAGARLPLRPVFVNVYGKEGETYSITVSLRPQMSVSDALYQAAAMFRDKHPKLKINPFEISVNSPEGKEEDCGEITQVGPWPKSTGGSWSAIVTDSKGRLVTAESCFISLMTTVVYPGYVISIHYLQDALEE